MLIEIARQMPVRMMRQSKGIDDVTAYIMSKIAVVQFVVSVL